MDLASGYRQDRVLLAGDAAHVHSPFGGQGLNLGLQDAATVAGWAPAGLLDTHTAERRPVAARVLHNTRAQVALMNPSPNSTPLYELFADMLAQLGRHWGWAFAYGVITAQPIGPRDHAVASPVLTRPDGYVAWAGTEGLAEAMETWFGHAA